jgi:hypothetical protein
MDLPSCKGVEYHWTGWQASSQELAYRHDPPRHIGVRNELGDDGHVAGRKAGTFQPISFDLAIALVKNQTELLDY